MQRAWLWAGTPIACLALWLLLARVFDESLPIEPAADPPDGPCSAPILRASHGARDSTTKRETVDADTDGAHGIVGAQVHGTLTLVEPDGAVVAKPAGQLSIRVRHDERQREVVVPVRDGRWLLHVADGASVRPRILRVGARNAAITNAVTVIVSERVNLALEARILPTTRLHVLDAGTGAPLSNVRVIHPTFCDSTQAFPGRDDEDAIVASGTSPLVLEPLTPGFGSHRCVVYAISPGRAWGRIALDTLAGGDRTLRLERAGGLRIRFAGHEPEFDVWVCAWRGDHDGEASPAFEFLQHNLWPRELPRLATGRYELRAFVGNWFRNPRVLASTTVEIEPGRLAEATLTLPPCERTPLVPLAGELHIPEAYGVEKPRLDFEYSEGSVDGESVWHYLHRGNGPNSLTSIGGPLGPWRFDAGRLPAGLYEVRVSGAGYRGVFVLGPDGDTGARIEVPPPGTVSVRVIDTLTGRDAEIDMVLWCLKGPPDRRLRMPRGSRHDKAKNRFVFRAPAGTVLLTAYNTLFHAEPCAVEVVAGGHAEATLRVTPAGMVDLVFIEGNARVPYHWEWPVEVTQIDGGGTSYLDNDEEGSLRLWIAGPGRYRIRVGPVPGYEPIAPRDVDVAVQEVTQVIVPLVPLARAR